ncbi:unnamed protein product, partial [Rotaria sp. Silwood2]
TTGAHLLSTTKQHTSEWIKFLFKQQPSTYVVIKNEKVNTSLCWNVVGFRTKKLKNTDAFERLEDFSCYRIWRYASTIDTRNILSHSCVKNSSNAIR